MTHLSEMKRQRSPRGVQYTHSNVDYAIPVKKKDVPRELKYAIEGNPIERTNRGTVLTTVPGSSCGCFGGKIEDNTTSECPWLYIFIPPTIPNPAALDYSSRRGHPPAKEIPNMTNARKRELRALCDKVGWELNTEDLWGDEMPASSDDTPQDTAFYANMSKMKKEGWYSWTIAPKGNFDKPEKWEITVGQDNAADEERRKHYDRKFGDFDDGDDVVATYGSMKDADDDFSGFGRVTESTKLTMTIGQLKRLVRESCGKNRRPVKESRKVDVKNRIFRAFTDALIEDAEEGIISWEEIARTALNYMSEDDVRDMAESELDYEAERSEDAFDDEEKEITEAHGDKNNRGWRKNKGTIRK